MTHPDALAHSNMSIREHFAGLIMGGIMSQCCHPENCGNYTETYASMAVEAADALIRRLNGESEPVRAVEMDGEYLVQDEGCARMDASLLCPHCGGNGLNPTGGATEECPFCGGSGERHTGGLSICAAYLYDFVPGGVSELNAVTVRPAYKGAPPLMQRELLRYIAMHRPDLEGVCRLLADEV